MRKGRDNWEENVWRLESEKIKGIFYFYKKKIFWKLNWKNPCNFYILLKRNTIYFVNYEN